MNIKMVTALNLIGRPHIYYPIHCLLPGKGPKRHGYTYCFLPKRTVKTGYDGSQTVVLAHERRLSPHQHDYGKKSHIMWKISTVQLINYFLFRILPNIIVLSSNLILLHYSIWKSRMRTLIKCLRTGTLPMPSMRRMTSSST